MKPSEIITEAVQLAGLTGWNGQFSELGFGEVNQSYRFSCDAGDCVVRVTKRKDIDTLLQEGRALRLLADTGTGQIPRLIFFDADKLIGGRMWIIESYIPGRSVERLSVPQFRSLGRLLAETHQVKNGEASLDLWQHFLATCRLFGDGESLLNHPDSTLRGLIGAGKAYLANNQQSISGMPLSLIHGDATPSNILVSGDKVSLIDWEFASFSDPMREFSAIYYDDMEYNLGKWRIKIRPDEKNALFDGYRIGGGTLYADRIDFWMNFDKLCAAVFLYWKIHQSGDKDTDQYELDLSSLVKSLQANLGGL